MLSERTIINALIVMAGMILGPYLIILTFELNQVALLSSVSIAVVFGIFFFVKDRIALLPMLGLNFQAGNLNFLPFSLTPTELCTMVAILYYVLNYVCLKRRPVTVGSKRFLFPILVIGAIILYHSRTMGLHGLGSSDAEGSRPAVLILLAITGYFCCINIPTPTISFIGVLPWFCVILVAISSIPFVLTTYFPSLAPLLFYVSNNINMDAYVASTHGGDVDDLARNRALLGISNAFMAACLAYFPLTTWWRPSRWIFIVLGLACLYGTVIGGYRSSLFGFFEMIVVSTLCYSKWRTLFVVPFLAIAPLLLVLVQDNHPMGMALPTTVQRSLSFMPGNWDSDVISSAEGSNDFRDDIRKVYLSEYFYKSPLIGNGYTSIPGEFDANLNMTMTAGVTDPSYYESKAFIASKQFHIGWISVYDAVGIIGSMAFVAFLIILLGTLAWSIFGPKGDPTSKLFPLKVWLFASVATTSTGFFTLFGDFANTFIALCSIALTIFHIGRAESASPAPVIVPTGMHVPQNMFRPVDAFPKPR